MKIELKPLADIKPYWRNPRNNEKAIEAVKASIERYGFNQPIAIDRKGVIISGHSRYKALIQLGWTEVPCITLDLSPEKAKEYRIADNKTSELASWDMTQLIPEIREIGDLAEMQIFFQDYDLNNLLMETATIVPVSAQEIEKAQEKMEVAFDERSQAVQGNYVEILCPHCGETFFVDKAEFNTQPTKGKGE